MRSSFHAGAAEIDITPHLGILLAGSFTHRPAEDIDDPLYAKAVILFDGTTHLVLLALDLIAIPLDVVTKIRERIFKQLDIPPSNVMIACTHTHTGPQTGKNGPVPRDDSYIEWLIGRVADVVTLAAKRLQPARIAWGQGEQHHISFCRRFLMEDGTVRTNPGHRGLAGSDRPGIVKPVSPIDPTVGVLAVESKDGRPIAVVTQFTLHYVGTDNISAISADYFGHFSELVRKNLGNECISMLFNGSSGQINNLNPLGPPRETTGRAHARQVALALAGETLKVVANLRFQSSCYLQGSSMSVSLPCKQVTQEDIAVAEQILAGNDPLPEKGPFSFVVGQPIPTALRPYYAGLVTNMPQSIETEVQVFRIGDSAWAALPGETFVEIGLEIKKNAPVDNTFVIGLANDNIGYIATDHALIHEGGYETWSRSGVGAEGVLVNAAGTLLDALFRQAP